MKLTERQINLLEHLLEKEIEATKDRLFDMQSDYPFANTDGIEALKLEYIELKEKLTA